MTITQQKQFKPLLLSLFVLCVFCTLVISITYELTRKRIKDNQQQYTLKMVSEVMPLPYNNDLMKDHIEVIEPTYLGTNKPVPVYRARLNDEPIGLVFIPIVADGYSGVIELAIGVTYDGTLTAVRVNQHQETEGLGDGIDQIKSDWIFSFDQRSLENTTPMGWAVKKDGGDFDQLSGATISSRAVINAIKGALDYYELNRDKLY